MPTINKIDSRTPFYIVYDQTDDPPNFKGYAPMGNADVSKINPNYIITGTERLSRYAVRKARNAGIIFGG